MPDYPDPPDLDSLVMPDPDDDEGTPQKPRKRLGIGRAKVPTKATRREKRELRRAAGQ